MPWSAVTQLDGRRCGGIWPESFDAVLLDAPCSGESLTRMGESVSERLDQSPGYIKQLASLQKQLAASALQALRVGGVMVYSTCTLNVQENEEVVESLLRTYGDAVERLPLDSLPGTEEMRTDNGDIRCWPQITDTQGFFVARLRKLKKVDGDKEGGDGRNKKTGSSNRFEAVNRKEAQNIERSFLASFGAWPGVCGEGLELWRYSKDIWLCPEVLRDLDPKGLRRCGIRLADTGRHRGYVAHFEWAVSFGHRLPENSLGVAMLDPEAAKEFCKGKDAEAQWSEASALADEGSQAIVRCGGLVVGFGRWKGRVVRNDTPAHWRCDGISL